ncbi:MAG: putative bifunctional diguanylate cyclase/phosphodiesterase [Hyphomicrobiaceae bacterium]
MPRAVTVRARALLSRAVAVRAARRIAPATSPRALIGRLGTAVTLITAFLPPLGFAIIGMVQLQDRAYEQATVGARHMEVLLGEGTSDIWANHVSARVLEATTGLTNAVVTSWIGDYQDRTVMSRGRTTAWPTVQARVPVRAAAHGGYFHIEMSTRDVVVSTLMFAGASLLLALAAFWCFRRVPLAALDHAMGLLNTKHEEVAEQRSQLERQNLRFDLAINNMSQGLCMFDADQRLLVCNKRYAAIYNLPDELIRPGTYLTDIISQRIAAGLYSGSPHDYLERLQAVAAENQPSSVIYEMSDKRVLSIAHQPMPGGGWVATHEDITEQRAVQQKVAHLALHDPLTNLANRTLLQGQLNEALKSRPEDAAILWIDLYRFKVVNDTLGQSAGDALLKSVAERLRACAAETDTVARIGGDEFAIVQIDPDQPAAASQLARRIVEELNRPFTVEGKDVSIGARIGIALAAADCTAVDQIMGNAGLALYRAKSERESTYRFFEPEMDARLQERRKLERDLREALVKGEMALVYQPIVNLESNEVCGFEALLRWKHAERGMVSPAEFIPLAEETGLIVSIGEWVLRQACAQASTWPEHTKIAVNLSAIQIKSPNLVETVFSALAASRLSPERLELEITESTLLHDSEATLTTLRRLHDIGVRIAMDDFGTGYSSLSYLRKFPFDKIKIDRCFVGDLSDTEDSVAVLRAVAKLGSSLGIATTAEGVETPEQLARVRAEGCTEMQGYLFSPPRPAQDIDRMYFPELQVNVA